jgi:hypothetical protein
MKRFILIIFSIIVPFAVSAQAISVNSGTYVAVSSKTFVTAQSIDNKGTFTILSDATGTGSLLTSGNSVSNTGTINVQRWFKSNSVGSTAGESNWHLVSSPLLDVESGIFTGHFLNYYDVSEGSFHAYSSKTETLNNGQGYVSKLDFTDKDGDHVPDNPNPIVFTGGNFGHDNVSMTLITGVGNTYFDLPGEFNLIGNPYPSSLDLKLLSDDNTSITNQLYYYVDDGNGVGSGGSPSNHPGKSGWRIFDASTSSNINDAGRIMSVGQAFGVIKIPSESTLTIKDAYRVHYAPDNGFSKKGDSQTKYLELISRTDKYTDKAYFRFNENATNDFDFNIDAFKLNSFANASPNTSFISADNRKQYICEMPTTESVDVGFNIREDADVTFSVENTTGFAELILEDKTEGTFTDLMKGTYDFHYTLGEAKQGRFTLHFTKGTLNEEDVFSGLKIYNNRNTLVLKSSKSLTDARLSLFNINGQLVFVKDFANLNTETVNTQLSNGIYLLKLKSNEGIKSQKIVIKN